MCASRRPSIPAKTAKQLPATRERILAAARQLIQRHGYYGANTAEMLKVAKAPKGSMYHHFPDGKEQIALEAVRIIRKEFRQLMQSPPVQVLKTAPLIRKLAKGMGRWLKSSHWREGSMLSSTIVGAVPDAPKIHAEIKAGFDEWRALFARRLVTEGQPIEQAKRLAQVIVAGLEGALILARVDGDEQTLREVAEQLALFTQFYAGRIANP